ncbi:MAG: hypothetical protein K0R54_574 [Clostridiaceae bacterium]|jgi:hypothetical protein|nr:hypothetical protein [Clostridiaceae bacterium]
MNHLNNYEKEVSILKPLSIFTTNSFNWQIMKIIYSYEG